MSNVISFERRRSQVQTEKTETNNLPPHYKFHDRNWICGEKKYVQDLKHAVDLYGFTREESRFHDICDLMGQGLSADYNLQISAKCGSRDEDVELELVCDAQGKLYYAIYTDSIQAHRSDKHSYYNVEFKLPMNYLLNSVKNEAVINGICLNPYSGTPVIVTRGEISQICQRACV